MQSDDPLGTVGGLIVDAVDQQPLGGVAVKIISGGTTLTAMTGSDGTFLVPQVPSGTFIFAATLTGYTGAQFESNLSGAVGSVLVKNPVATLGPLGLVKATGTFNVRLIDESGAPVPMVTVTARAHQSYVDFSGGNAFGVGSTPYRATSGADGLLQFTGLPDYAGLGSWVDDSFTVDVPPVRISGSESYSFLGLSVTFDLLHLSVTAEAPSIVLAGPHTPLQVIGTNIPTLRGTSNLVESLTVPPNGPLTIAFNQAIDPSSVRVVFYNEDAVTPATAQPMTTVTTNLMSMTPNQALIAGGRYNVLVHVDALLSPTISDVFTEYDTVAPFFVEQASGVTPTVNATSISKTVSGPGIVTVTFTLNEPIGIGQFDPSPIDCVAFYEGVNLDNGDPANYVGEWSASGQGLECFGQGNPPPGMNITVLRPVEQAPSSLITGFASKFAIVINNSPPAGVNPAPCKPADPVGSCAGPQAGNKIHLVFSKLPVGETIRRTNGQTVFDDPVKLVIPIP